jgi:hypothetical protein
MPKVRYLKIEFANRIYASQVPYFRAAVIEATERQSSLFHNHQPDSRSIYRYPLIQYKALFKRAAMICLEAGTDDIHYLFRQRDLDLRIGNEQQTFQIEDIHLQYFNVQTRDTHFEYALKDWMALNQENYQRYTQLQTEVERYQFLDQLLRANLLTFTEALGFEPQIPLEVGITRMKDERWLQYKRQKVLCFSLNFRTNLSLPNFIGLGKGVSVGYGSVMGIGKLQKPRPSYSISSRQNDY